MPSAYNDYFSKSQTFEHSDFILGLKILAGFGIFRVACTRQTPILHKKGLFMDNLRKMGIEVI